MRGSSYSWLERSLHWVALEPQSVRELAFDLERKHSAGDANSRGERADGAVYVCGLARSGTTVVLRALARLGVFRSLSYRDMPFVLAPNLWRKLSGGTRSQAPTERAHGDGILVDFDSPEAFEEVFWRTFCPQPEDPRLYGSAQPSAEALAAFAQYRTVVANPLNENTANAPLRRYLSKNNNNLMRLDALATDATSSILVAYRDPVEAARSLFRQHQRFCAAQRDSAFTRSYMGWLGHHEFGLDHRPFGFALDRMNPRLAPEHPDYWLDYWSAVHDRIVALSHPQVRLIDHDALRAEPVRVLSSVLDAIRVPNDAAGISGDIAAAPGERRAPDEFAPDLLARAYSTHGALRVHPRNAG